MAPARQVAVAQRTQRQVNNFYVITRYNRRPLYAMAVFELSEAIRAGFAQ